MGKSKIVDAEAMALYDQKMDDVDMADALGVVPLTVKNWRKKHNLPSLVGPGNRKHVAAPKEEKRQEHLCSAKVCKKCQFWSVNGKFCDYYLINGLHHRRPCPAGPDCTAFAPRKRSANQNRPQLAKKGELYA